jgi:hypothetical protein
MPICTREGTTRLAGGGTKTSAAAAAASATVANNPTHTNRTTGTRTDTKGTATTKRSTV